MNESKPLYSLTVKEYQELNTEFFNRLVDKIIENKLQNLLPLRPNEDIIFIDEAVTITGYKKSTIYSKVSRFEIPVISRLRPLTFSRKSLIEWIENGKPVNMIK